VVFGLSRPAYGPERLATFAEPASTEESLEPESELAALEVPWTLDEGPDDLGDEAEGTQAEETGGVE
jgi:hypothetical protein